MLIALTAEQETFLADLGAYLDGLDAGLVEAARSEYLEDPMCIREQGRAFVKRLGADGWLGVGWPAEFGGHGRSAMEQWLFQEEMCIRKLPAGLLTLSSIGPTLIRAGSPEQQAELLPRILAGELDVAIGYTEPEAGTDLASLRTKATRDAQSGAGGDAYVIDGQKVYTTGAHVATHLWLAARTGPPDSKHKGISLFILPMETEGISVRPIMTQGDERTNEVFLDGVRAPSSSMVGPENGGWGVITMQLNFERLFSHNEARYELRRLVEWAGDRLERDAACRTAVGVLAADVEVARLFSMRAAWMLDQGKVPVAEASLNKVWHSELRQRICATALELMGPEGQLACGADGAPLGGDLERAYRASTVVKFGGGANEVQRNIIAQQGLGMPR